MKAAVIHGPGDLRLDDVPRPAAGPRDIVIKVVAAGICGTDIHFRHLGPRFADRPMPLGHEFAGEIVEVGSQVRRFNVGERVAYNSNNSPSDTGRGGEGGGFSSYIALRDVDGHVQSLISKPAAHRACSRISRIWPIDKAASSLWPCNVTPWPSMVQN